MTTDPMLNKHVKEAMDLMFHLIMKKWQKQKFDPTGLLLICFANIIYHEKWLRKV